MLSDWTPAILFIVSTSYSLIRQNNLKTKFLMNKYHVILQKLFTPKTTAPRQSVGSLFEKRIQYFAKVMADFPLKNQAKVVHVAGTKGKGSVVEYINAGVTSSAPSVDVDNNNMKPKVGVFTSPHIHTARERLKINNQIISIEDFVRLGENALKRAESSPNCEWIVFFDLLLTMALEYFSEQDVDLLILETGIGGRFDSTNVFPSVHVSVITRIGLDHQLMLGDSIEEIAWQKAGIIKQHSHVFTPATQEMSVLNVLRQECILKHATLAEVQVDKNNLPTQLNNQIIFDVQKENACLAASVLVFLGFPLGGMKNYYWPCRMEIFSIGDNIDCIIDGSHNGESVELFLRGVKNLKEYENAFIIAVFGAGQEKCVNDMITVLEQSADYVLFVQSSHFKALSERELTEIFIKLDEKLEHKLLHNAISCSLQPPLDRKLTGTVCERLQWIIDESRKNGSSLHSIFGRKRAVFAICGSLFSAAEARQILFRNFPNSFRSDDWVRSSDNLICEKV